MKRLEVYREAGGRSFQRAGDAWHQIDLLPKAPQRQVDLESAAGKQLLAEHEWLSELLTDARQVAFVGDGETIVLTAPED